VRHPSSAVWRGGRLARASGGQPTAGEQYGTKPSRVKEEWDAKLQAVHQRQGGRRQVREDDHR